MIIRGNVAYDDGKPGVTMQAVDRCGKIWGRAVEFIPKGARATINLQAGEMRKAKVKR